VLGVYTDEFEARLAKVRHRFASSLESKITDTAAALPRLAGGAPGAAAILDDAYRRIHTICGVGPTVGFTATGQAAREAEAILLIPMRDKRGLTAQESVTFKQALDTLWDAARSELQMMHQRGG